MLGVTQAADNYPVIFGVSSVKAVLSEFDIFTVSYMVSWLLYCKYFVLK